MSLQYADRWGLITGASSGIGAEFARQLAARGMHLVLTARRENLLAELASELDQRHATKCEIIAEDLSDPDGPGRLYQAVVDRTLEIELLVNNAGIGHVSTVQDTDRERVLQLLRLNVTALTDLTYRFLPPMLQRQHGAIINVASTAAFRPVAFMGAYAASKAYVLHFSEALWAEMRDQGVIVTALCPGTTRTEFFESAGVSGWLKKHRAQTAAQVVRSALRGLRKERQYIVSGWMNSLLTLAVRLAPRKTAVLESMKYFRPSPKSETSTD